MAKQTGKGKVRKPSRRMTRILADNIRTFRKLNDLSQESLANMCDLHRTYVGSVEREERNVTLSTLEVMAEALGVSVEKLLIEGGIENGYGK